MHFSMVILGIHPIQLNSYNCNGQSLYLKVKNRKNHRNLIVRTGIGQENVSYFYDYSMLININ